ncbi:hypothetical protein L9F63_018441, partial [Diploptera punctata]
MMSFNIKNLYTNIPINETVNIIEEKLKERKLEEIYIELNRMVNTVAVGDGLPSRICQQCHKHLQHWAEFRQRCHQINATLHGCLDESKLENLEETVSSPSKESSNSVTVNEDKNDVSQDGVNDDESEKDGDIPEEDRLSPNNSQESNISDNSKQKVPKKNGILTKTGVLGNKQNTQKDNNESSQGQHKPNTCNKCGKVFETEDELHDHEEVHSETQSFPCILCGKTFLKKKYFEIHMRHHTGNKGHRCGSCGREFGNRTKLTVHMRIHTGEKPYACNLCTKTFRHKKSLSKHSYTHTKEKPFQCSVCKRGFSDKWHLTQHFRLHTGEKPYR